MDRRDNDKRRVVARDYFLRWRILDRMRRFLRPSFRRPLPDFLVPKSVSLSGNEGLDAILQHSKWATLQAIFVMLRQRPFLHSNRHQAWLATLAELLTGNPKYSHTTRSTAETVTNPTICQTPGHHVRTLSPSAISLCTPKNDMIDDAT